MTVKIIILKILTLELNYSSMKNVKIVYLDKKNYIDTLKSFLLSISNSKLVKILIQL